MNWSSPLRVLATLLLALACCNAAHADPEVGWWWNPYESGRGFFIESQGGNVFLAGYFYENDGRATWLVSSGSNSDPYSYQGRLLRVTGGQTLFGDYKPPAVPTDAGPVSLQFTDDQHGTLTWPGGTIAIEREYFGVEGDTPIFQPQSGWWWNAAESGRGYSIEVEGSTLFAVAFMYDDAGNPVWYLSSGPMSTPTHYEGQWLQIANGQTLGGAYRPPSTTTPVGRLIIDFTTVGDAVVTSNDSISVLKRTAANRSRTTRLTREFNYPQPYNLPGSFAGTFAESLVVKENLAGEVVEDRIDVTSDFRFVEREGDLLGTIYFPNEPSATYVPGPTFPGSRPLHLHWERTSDNADTGEHCVGTYDGDLGALPRGNITVGSYSGLFKGKVDFGPIAVAMIVTCTIAGSDPETRSALLVVPLGVELSGPIKDDYIKFHYEGQPIPDVSKLNVDISLKAVR